MSSDQTDVLIDLELFERQGSLKKHEDYEESPRQFRKQKDCEDSPKQAIDASHDNDWLNQQIESSDSSRSDGISSLNGFPNANLG